MTRDRPDVLIIGAGPSGAVTARHLAEHGFSVVCLEQGRWINNTDFPGDKFDFELQALKRWSHDPNVRQLDEDYPCEVSKAEVHPVMYNAVGGGSIHYGAQWPRHLPSDFRVRTLDGVADDWPLTYEDLVPFYEQNDIDLGVSGMAGDPAYPDGAPPPLPALPINRYGRKFAQGLNALGWHWWPAPNAIASRDYRNLGACARYGTCENGCPNGSKASVDMTHWPEAQRHGDAGDHRRAGTRDHHRRAWPGHRGHLHRSPPRRAPSAGQHGGVGRQRRGNTAAAAAVAQRTLPRGAGERVGIGR